MYLYVCMYTYVSKNVCVGILYILFNFLQKQIVWIYNFLWIIQYVLLNYNQ